MNDLKIQNNLIVQESIKNSINLVSFDVNYGIKHKHFIHRTVMKTSRVKENKVIPSRYRYMLQQQNMISGNNQDKYSIKLVNTFKELIDGFIRHRIIPKRFRYKTSIIPIYSGFYRYYIEKERYGTKTMFVYDIKGKLEQRAEYFGVREVEPIPETYYIELCEIDKALESLLTQKLQSIIDMFGKGLVVQKTMEIIKVLRELGRKSEGQDFDEYIDEWVKRLLK